MRKRIKAVTVWTGVETADWFHYHEEDQQGEISGIFLVWGEDGPGHVEIQFDPEYTCVDEISHCFPMSRIAFWYPGEMEP